MKIKRGERDSAGSQVCVNERHVPSLTSTERINFKRGPGKSVTAEKVDDRSVKILRLCALRASELKPMRLILVPDTLRQGSHFSRKREREKERYHTFLQRNFGATVAQLGFFDNTSKRTRSLREKRLYADR